MPPEFSSLSNLSETIPVPSGEGTWVWWNDDEFVHYSSELNETIERAYKAGKSLINFSVVNNGSPPTPYTIYFDKFIQINDRTTWKRQVQRLSQMGGIGSCEIPVNRFNIDQHLSIQYPAEWERQENIC